MLVTPLCRSLPTGPRLVIPGSSVSSWGCRRSLSPSALTIFANAGVSRRGQSVGVPRRTGRFYGAFSNTVQRIGVTLTSFLNSVLDIMLPVFIEVACGISETMGGLS